MTNDDDRTDGPASEEAPTPERAQGPAAQPGVRRAPGRQRLPSRQTIARDERRDRSGRRTSRRRWFYGIGGGTIAIMLIAGLFLPSLPGPGTTASADQVDDTPPSGTAVPVQPGDIIEPGAGHDPYSTLPPTSGPRYAEPAPWGAHDAQIDDETVVRNLAVGAVVFNHNLESEAEVSDLRLFVESLPGYPGCYVVHPYAAVPSGSVTLTSWGWTQQVAGVDRFLMETFVDDHVNLGAQFLGLSCGAPPAVPTPDAATSPADTEQGE